MAIFNHQDNYGDELEVLVQDSHLLFSNAASLRSSPEIVTVKLDRKAQERLYNALGEHLYPSRPQPTPEEWEEAREAFRKLATGLANAILPLSQALQGLRAPVGVVDEAQEMPDPEPRDVGHPTYEDAQPTARVSPYPPSLHMATEAECKARNCAAARHLSETATTQPKQLVGCTCGHSWSNHDETGCTCLGGGVFLKCACKRRPPAGEPCGLSEPLMRPLDDLCGLCGYAWRLHPQVHVKRSIPCDRPECGHSRAAHVYMGTGCDVYTCGCKGYEAPVPDPKPKCTECGHAEADHRTLHSRPCVWAKCSCPTYRSTP